MESKKINQLATSVNPSTSDLAIIGDPITGVSKKITWLQVSSLIGTAANLQQVTDNGATTTNPITIGGLTISGLSTGVLKSDSGVISSVPFGGANGVATLGGDGKVPSNQLPSYVDDVVEVANFAALPVTGETGKIYITLDNNKVYRWTGSTYVEIAANNAVWGAITGTLSNQTDLQNALNAKVPTSRTLSINGTSYDLSANRSWSVGSVTSVGLTSTAAALTITNSPITSSGNIGVNFAGSSTQYVAGDGSLVTFPTIVTEAQNLITEVYNETGATLTKGTIVYINGGHGNLPTITKALAIGDSTSAQTYGIVQADITNNNNGYVIATGRISNLDTQAYAAGTQLYLSPSTAGTWTSTKPYAPYHLVYVGIVVRSHPTQGIIEVKIQNGYELDELHNVSAQSPSNNDGIFYNTSTSLWEKKSVATALGYTPISGSGTTNYIPKFTGSTALGNSLLFDNGTNVGIGTASPSYKLDVSGTGRYLGNVFINPSNVSVLGLEVASEQVRFRADSTTTTTPKLLDIFTGSGNAVLFSVGGYGTYYDTDMSFYTQNASTGPNSLPNLHLKSNGNVGIYNYTPSYRLDVTGTGRFTGQLRLDSTITNGTYTYTLPSATGTLALTSDIPSLTGYISGSGSSGRIPYFNGTNSVTSTANLNWDNSNNFITTSGVYVYNNTTNAYILTSNGDNVGTVFNVSATRWGLGYSLSPSTLATAALSWDSTGKVSIGNTNSTYNFDVTGTGRYTGALIANSFSTPATGTAGSTIWSLLHDQYVAGDFGIYTPSNAIIYINASGSIGINNTSPSYTLDVTGTGRFTNTLLLDTATNPTFRMNGGASGSPTIRLDQNSVAKAWMYLTSGGTLQINTTASDGQGITINSSNNVGIGYLTPSAKLTIVKGSRSSTLGASSVLQISDAIATGQAVGDRAEINFYTNSNSLPDNLQHATIGIVKTSTTGNETADLYFATSTIGGSPNERMRITSAGQVIIGSSASLYGGVKLSVKQTTANNAAEIWSNSASDSGRPALILIKNDNVSSSSQVFQRFAIDNANSANGQINGNGAAQVAFGSWSDIRLKQNIEDLPSQLSNIMSLRPVEFDYKNGIGHQIGFIAQEMQEVYSDVVCEDTDGYLTITGWSKTEARLVKAIQELKAELDELKAKIK